MHTPLIMLFSDEQRQKPRTGQCYRMSNLRCPGSRSRGRSRYFWITCTWPWLSMKSRSSAASEEMRMPSPNRAKTKQKWSTSSHKEKLSVKPGRKHRLHKTKTKLNQTPTGGSHWPAHFSFPFPGLQLLSLSLFSLQLHPKYPTSSM